MAVIWLIPAQDRVEDTLGAAGAKGGALSALLERLSEQLVAAFPESDAIVVLDRLEGYCNDPGKHVLRVQVQRGPQSRARVVKIASPEEISRERAGWESCQRGAEDGGRVFMVMKGREAGCPEAGALRTLVYEDAYQSLRAPRIVSLEEAVRHCCRWRVPATSSVLGVLNQIFAEMADRLYRRSWSQEPNDEVCRYWRKRIERGLSCWTDPGEQAGQCREVVLGAMLGKPSFLDPCQCMDRVLNDPAFVPQMRRGCAHGDLHGRNILVGIVDSEALFPALFDYEDMARDNYLGWDFVKLETELKVRVLSDIHPGDEMSFVAAVDQFEKRLAEETESRNDKNFEDWTDLTEHRSERDRLLAIVLGIRRLAKRCLEQIHKENRRWLHEYYFLLAAYGVYAGRFPSYRRRDHLACLVCAGGAAARYAWAYTNFTIPDKAAQAKARQALTHNDPEVRLDSPAVLSHRPELVFATIFVRSRRPEFVRAGVEILEGLKARHDRVLEIWQELALAYLELYDLTNDATCVEKGQRLLHELDSKCPSPHYETLCRWGRLWKDRGDRALDEAPERPVVQTSYERARYYYERAHQEGDEQKRYYPGINVATLSLLLGRPSEAEQLAAEILPSLQNRPPDAGPERVWVLATMAEANLLLGKCDEAASLYQTALLHESCEPHFRESMAKQVRRILRVRPCPETDFGKLFDAK